MPRLKHSARRSRNISAAAAIAANLVILGALSVSPRAQGDVTPPTLIARSPAPGATGVSPRVIVQVTFSEAISAATLTMQLRNAANQVVQSTVAYNGTSIWGEWFSGSIDEVRLYNRALSQAEIQAGMTQTLGGS